MEVHMARRQESWHDSVWCPVVPRMVIGRTHKDALAVFLRVLERGSIELTRHKPNTDSWLGQQPNTDECRGRPLVVLGLATHVPDTSTCTSGCREYVVIICIPHCVPYTILRQRM